jgi:radical SAM protein with 4Fe4S-binding SPASM domain
LSGDLAEVTPASRRDRVKKLSTLVEEILRPEKVVYAAATQLSQFESQPDGLNPFTVEIQPTDVCSHNCVYCSYAVRRQARNSWPTHVLTAVCDDLIRMNTKAVYFSGGGEPTLHSGFVDAVWRLKNAGIPVALNTNGFFRRVILEAAPALSYILVHIADTDRVGYQALMGLDGVSTCELPGVVRASGGPVPLIGARVVVVDQNVRRVPEIAADLKRSGFDYVIYSVVKDFENSGVALSPQGDALLQEFRTDDLFKSGFASVGYPATQPYSPTTECWVTTLRLNAIIAPSGSVNLCIPDVESSDLSIGNVFSQPFRLLWNGERHHKVMNQLQSRYRSGACRNCRFIRSNSMIASFMANAAGMHREFL